MILSPLPRTPRGVRRVSLPSLPGALLTLMSACGGQQVLLGGGGDSGCVPGTYSGPYTCDDGLDGALQSMTSGTIRFALQGDRGAAALRIAPGTPLTSTASGTSSTSQIDGTLDCTSYELTGTVTHITLTTGSITLTSQDNGTLSAAYDDQASPPAFAQGVIHSPQPVPGGVLPEATCAWTATLEP
jgi:hypothetical protein